MQQTLQQVVSRDVTVGDVQLRVHSVGSGERGIIALHGGMGLDSGYFNCPALKEHGNRDYQVIWFDQRGQGQSGQTGDATYTHANWAKDVIALSEQLGLKSFDLLGHSYGGYIALEVALLHPSNLGKLILVDSRPGPVDNCAAYLVGLEPGDSAGLKEYFKQRWQIFFPGEDKQWDIFERTQFQPEAYFSAFSRELPSFDVSMRLHEIDAPTLLVMGQQGLFVDGMMRLRQGISDAKFANIEGAGHFPFLDCPRDFANQLRDFLSLR